MKGGTGAPVSLKPRLYTVFASGNAGGDLLIYGRRRLVDPGLPHLSDCNVIPLFSEFSLGLKLGLKTC